MCCSLRQAVQLLALAAPLGGLVRLRQRHRGQGQGPRCCNRTLSHLLFAGDGQKPCGTALLLTAPKGVSYDPYHLMNNAVRLRVTFQVVWPRAHVACSLNVGLADTRGGGTKSPFMTVMSAELNLPYRSENRV